MLFPSANYHSSETPYIFLREKGKKKKRRNFFRVQYGYFSASIWGPPWPACWIEPWLPIIIFLWCTKNTASPGDRTRASNNPFFYCAFSPTIVFFMFSRLFVNDILTFKCIIVTEICFCIIDSRSHHIINCGLSGSCRAVISCPVCIESKPWTIRRINRSQIEIQHGHPMCDRPIRDRTKLPDNQQRCTAAPNH